MHKLTEKDIEARRAMCSICGPVKMGNKGKSATGVQKWECNNVKLAKRKKAKKRFRTQNLKECCEKCGFIPEHICQLDIDHIDGNHNNNDSSNLQTLCANCHRLKTFINGEHFRYVDRTV